MAQKAMETTAVAKAEAAKGDQQIIRKLACQQAATQAANNTQGFICGWQILRPLRVLRATLPPKQFAPEIFHFIK